MRIHGSKPALQASEAWIETLALWVMNKISRLLMDGSRHCFRMERCAARTCQSFLLGAVCVMWGKTALAHQLLQQLASISQDEKERLLAGERGRCCYDVRIDRAAGRAGKDLTCNWRSRAMSRLYLSVSVYLWQLSYHRVKRETHWDAL